MNKLNIKITTEEERADYIKQLQEMEIEKPAQKWSEGGAIDGYYVNALSKIIPLNNYYRNDDSKNTFKTKAQAESILAYAQLTQLMAEVNGDWESSLSEYVECISTYNNKLVGREVSTLSYYEPMCFKTAEIRDKFLADHQELLKTYFQI